MSYREELERIYHENGSILTPGLVVAAAESEDSPLHDAFNWDNDDAAHKYRLAQARNLIKRYRVEYVSAKDPDQVSRVRAYHSVPGPTGPVYRHVEDLIQTPLQERLVRTTMRREWRAFQLRYQQYEEFWQMVAADLKENGPEGVIAA